MGTQTTITATGIKDLSGEVLGRGKIRFFGPVDQNGFSRSAVDADGQPIVCTHVYFNVVDGEITGRADGGEAKVFDTANTVPQNIGYRVQILDADDVEVQGPGYECVQPTGESWQLAPAPGAPLSANPFPLNDASLAANTSAILAVNGKLPVSAVGSPWPAVKTFGDSIKFGAGSTLDGDTSTNGVTGAVVGPRGRGFGAQVVNAFGPGSKNFARGSDMSEDMAFKVYLKTSPKVAHNSAVTMMIGTNDVNVAGNTTSGLNFYRSALMHSAAWASIPDVAKVMADSPLAISTGTWVADTNPVIPHGIYSTTNGSSKTYSVTLYGSVLYVGVQFLNGSSGTATVKDGTTVLGTVNFNCPIVTANGAANTLGLLRFTGLTPGAHTITVTVTSTTGAGNTVYVTWLGGPYPAAASTVAPPAVFLCGVPYTYNDVNSAATAAYNTAAHDVATTLAGDGCDVRWVDTRALTNATTSYTGGSIGPNGTYYAPSPSDLIGLHWGNYGHFQMAQGLLSAMGVAPVRSQPYGPSLGYAQAATGYIAGQDRPALLLNSDPRDGSRAGVYFDGTNTFIEAPPGGVVAFRDDGDTTGAINSLTSDNLSGGVLKLRNKNAAGVSTVEFWDNNNTLQGAVGYENPAGDLILASVNGPIRIFVAGVLVGGFGFSTAPSGSCGGQEGAWVFSKDGHITFADPSTHAWVSKV